MRIRFLIFRFETFRLIEISFEKIKFQFENDSVQGALLNFRRQRLKPFNSELIDVHIN